MSGKFMVVGEFTQRSDLDGGGEAFDSEIARVDLEQACCSIGDCLGVVVEMGAVRHAGFPNPGTGRRHEIGQAEASTDLDEFPATDDDLACHRRVARTGRTVVSCHLVTAQRSDREQQRSATIVDDQCVVGSRAGSQNRLLRTDPPLAASTGLQVHLDIDVAGRTGHGPSRRFGQRSAAEVGVDDDSGGVEHRGQ